jgi:intracellular multiplication protein IcmV
VGWCVSFTGRIKKIIKPLVDVPTWIGYRQLAAANRSIFSFAKKCLLPEEAGVQESFSTAFARLQLTEADLAARIKVFKRLQWLWMILFLVSIAYGVYLLSEHALRGFFPCLGFSFVILTQVFRYHFWIFQIRHRRLGCTFREWLDTSFFSGKKIP